LTGSGVRELWSHVERYVEMQHASGRFTERRTGQARAWLWNEAVQELESALRSDPNVQAALPGLEKAVAEGGLPPTTGARRLLEIFFDNRGEA
jgi:LAO/AO transport system kinase